MNDQDKELLKKLAIKESQSKRMMLCDGGRCFFVNIKGLQDYGKRSNLAVRKTYCPSYKTHTSVRSKYIPSEDDHT